MSIQSRIAVIALSLAATTAVAHALDEPKGPHECPMMAEGAKPQLKASVELTQDGAVLKLVAANAGEIAKVQALAKMMAKHMEAGCDGGCGMMMQHGAKKPGGKPKGPNRN